MNKLTQGAKYLGIALLLSCLLISFSAFTFASPKAANARTLSASMVQVQKQAAAVKPNAASCYFEVNWQMPSPTRVTEAISTNYDFSWYCSPNIVTPLTFIIDWRDGHTSTYTCRFNCGVGQASVAYAYSRPGTFIAKIYWDQSSQVASWLTVDVAA